MKKTLTLISSLVLLAALPLSASAAGLGLGVSANASTGSTSTGVSLKGDVGTGARAAALVIKAVQRADQEIERRITNLTALSTRIGAMIKLSADEKTSLQTSLSAQIAAMNTLKTTIDGDATTSLKADIQSITKDYRIYMLILPQGRIAAVADRILTIVGQFQTLGPKLQARVTAAGSAGVDITALNLAMSDFNAKVADASVQANAAVSETASLMPDNGDATVAASNTAALKDAKTKLQAATADLRAARADAQTIIAGVKGKGGASATASSTTTVNP